MRRQGADSWKRTLYPGPPAPIAGFYHSATGSLTLCAMSRCTSQYRASCCTGNAQVRDAYDRAIDNRTPVLRPGELPWLPDRSAASAKLPLPSCLCQAASASAKLPRWYVPLAATTCRQAARLQEQLLRSTVRLLGNKRLSRSSYKVAPRRPELRMEPCCGIACPRSAVSQGSSRAYGIQRLRICLPGFIDRRRRHCPVRQLRQEGLVGSSLCEDGKW